MRSPFDGDWTYWARRVGKSPYMTPRQAAPEKKPESRCGHCHEWFENGRRARGAPHAMVTTMVTQQGGLPSNWRQTLVQLEPSSPLQCVLKNMINGKTRLRSRAAAKVASTGVKPSPSGEGMGMGSGSRRGVIFLSESIGKNSRTRGLEGRAATLALGFLVI